RGAQARLRLRGALHHARPLAPARVRGPDRDHVRGRDRRDGVGRAPRGEPAAPVHAGPAPFLPAAERPGVAADRYSGLAPRPARSPDGLPVPSTLPALPARAGGPLPAPDDRAPEAARDRAGPRGRVPSRRGGDAMTAAAPLEVKSLMKRFPIGNGL